MDENIGEYCSLDKGGKRPQRELTTGEKEQLFLEAMMVRRRSRRTLRAAAHLLLSLSMPAPQQVQSG